MLPRRRLISLDVFRGLTIAFMLLVNNPGDWAKIYGPLRHARWHGCTPADLVFPFFLFIVGVSVVFSTQSRLRRGAGVKRILAHAVFRATILFLLGLLLNGFPFYDLEHIRVPGVLQRIALVYAGVVLLHVYLGFRALIVVFAALAIFYQALLTLVPVPGYGAPSLEPQANLASWLDRALLSGHLWKYSRTWDPEGLLSTLGALCSGILGLIAGRLLASDRGEASTDSTEPFYGRRLELLLPAVGVLCITAGGVWGLFFPLNKNLWTSSFALFTGGWALLVLGLLYYLCDVRKPAFTFDFFRVFGQNAISAYALSVLVARTLNALTLQFASAGGKALSLKQYLFSGLFHSLFATVFSAKFASLLWALSFTLCFYFLLRLMRRRGIFLKI